MKKEELKKLIDISAGRELADIVIENCKIIDVYSGKIIEGNIAISDKWIAGIGNYKGKITLDAEGKYAAPGFIDSHIHIESSYLSPEELGKLIVPHGGTCIVADPHEIVNVCGIEGLNYMIEAAKNTALDIKYMIPSCVPCTPFENSGAIIDASKMREPITRKEVLGLGEFMNFPGVVAADNEILDKVMVAKESGKFIDGHSPGIANHLLNAYTAIGIRTDHECSTVEEMNSRISRGVYVLLREGSACKDLRNLIKGVTKENSRRCLLCSDDRQPRTILELGHIDNHLQICVEEGLDPITAIQMATINAAECYGMRDRGAIAPGLRADIVLLEDLEKFKVKNVFIEGKEVARDGEYLLEIKKHSIESVRSSMQVKDFNIDKLKMKLKSNKVYTIDIQPGGVLTKKGIAEVKLDKDGDFIFESDKDIVKIAVIERHKNTGNVATALLRGYGIKRGAVALSIAHDSHNIIAVGISNEEISTAVNKLIEQGGGIVLVENGEVLESMPMPIAGIMSDKDGVWVDNKLEILHKIATEKLSISTEIEPIMTLCFMSLIVIPEIKISDRGLFDVKKFEFIKLEVEGV